MDCYIEIKVLPDPEFDSTTLMNALYSKLHRALVDVGHGEIGVSFPHMGKTPGDVLRLHANRMAIDRLMGCSWLKGLCDYTAVSQVLSIPQNVGHVNVSRVQSKKTAARLRRSVKRGSISKLQAEEILADRTQIKKPFFRLRSSSTGQHFPLFIERSKLQQRAVFGSFSAYGLSEKATVPYF